MKPKLKKMKYCPSLTAYQRYVTRQVNIGNLTMGGDAPIRVQSMTTADTLDIEASVEESIRMIDAGCELVRLTAPSKKDALALKEIKSALKERGYDTPLVADIHFTPNAAEIAAGIVEKVRVNPGNYADKKKFEEIEYTDASYQAELDRIREKFTPLVKLCKENGTAMRIGTNHGSLSDRILSRYGDTPKGMVESAMEFIRICRDHDFHDLVISMKASNTLVMVQAYRLLVHEMMENDMNYPLHLGVTEAGDGEDGRIKSAVGIGTLLEDGLGDTVRVSLTEAPEAEIPVAQALVNRYQKRSGHKNIAPFESELPYNPFAYQRRNTKEVLGIGGSTHPVVFSDFSHKNDIKFASFFPIGYRYSVPLDKWNLSDSPADFVYLGENSIDFEIPGTLSVIQDYSHWDKEKERHYPLLDKKDLKNAPNGPYFLLVDASDLTFINELKSLDQVVLVLKTENMHGMAEQRRFFIELLNNNIQHPVILSRSYNSMSDDLFMLSSSTDFGGLLIDGFGDGIWMDTAQEIPLSLINATAFGILQATRTRISKTEYISCPSCGRTLFDLQETTARIRKRTHHLKGVKIGIMGCIVNGPGEMADADYGYVGTGKGVITLYKEKEVVKRNVPTEQAVDALIDLIKEHGDWVEIQNE